MWKIVLTDRKQAGFSLYELVSVVSVIGLLATVGIHYSKDMRNRITFRSHFHSIFSDLQHAKLSAIKANSPVVFKETADGYILFVDNGHNGGKRDDWNHQPGEKILRQFIVPEGYSLTTNFTAGRTRFNTTIGMKAGTITLEEHNKYKARVVVSTIGRLRMEREK